MTHLPVIVDAVRTPIGKRNGWLAGVSAPRLLAEALFGLLDRTGVDPSAVDQIVCGCVTQAGMPAGNIARNSSLSRRAGYTTAATSIDCQCGSGQQANHFMAGLVASGAVKIGIAGGVEHMSGVPL